MAVFVEEERVFVHGLVSGRGRPFNLRPARVIRAAGTEGGRIGVELLVGGGAAAAAGAKRARREGGSAAASGQCPAPEQLLVRPANLLRALDPADRRKTLLAQLVASLPALLVVRRFLDERLPSGPGCGSPVAFAGSGGTSGGEGAGGGGGGLEATFTQDSSPLLFRIAEFLAAPREFPHQFSGYMRQLWAEHWRFDALGRPAPLGAAIRGPGGVAAPSSPLRARIDCGAVSLGPELPGLVLFAGGCGAHPAQCRFNPELFYKSAVLYDSLLDEWRELPDMPTRRHGCSAARVGRQVFVLGGQYVHDRVDDEGAGAGGAGGRAGEPASSGAQALSSAPSGIRFCDVFDTSTWRWARQRVELGSESRALMRAMDNAAFFGAGAVGGRVVACLFDRARGQVVTAAFNPERPEDSWRQVVCPDGSDSEVSVGQSSCTAAFRGALVVASGRPPLRARCVAAFRFVDDASCASTWHHGSWQQLPELTCDRVGGALVVVEGRLYATGGVDEQSGEFRDDLERLDDYVIDGDEGDGLRQGASVGDENSDGAAGDSAAEAAPPTAPRTPRWTRVTWARMPRPLHAHECLALPTLASQG